MTDSKHIPWVLNFVGLAGRPVAVRCLGVARMHEVSWPIEMIHKHQVKVGSRSVLNMVEHAD